MAGVFAPPKKYRLGSGGGHPKAGKAGGTMMGFAVALMFPKPSSPTSTSRPSAQAKHAFGGGSRSRMSGRAVMTVERTSRRVPEAVVRITGRQHGGGHVLANFSYISRLGHGEEKELGLETSDGDVLRDGRDMQLLAKEWHDFEMDGDARRKGATSISMILSMPTGTDSESLKAAAIDFAKDEFANRSWVASLHVDRDHPHVHLTIARRDHDGRRFHPNRDDLFRWRQRFAEKLRERGIEANATPTKARGIDPKHEPIAAVKMREKGQTPQIDKSRLARAQRLREQGIDDPVVAHLASRQEVVRATYMRSIAELSTSPSAADRVVAQSLERFVATLPEPEPNSSRAIRVAREARVEVRTQDAAKIPIGRGVSSAPYADRRSSIAERMRALHQDLTSPQTPRGTPDLPRAEGEKQPPSDVASRMKALMQELENDSDNGPERRPSGTTSDRLRALLDEEVVPTKPMDREQANEALRQAEERNRAQRERDRSLDKDRPSR